MESVSMVKSTAVSTFLGPRFSGLRSVKAGLSQEPGLLDQPHVGVLAVMHPLHALLHQVAVLGTLAALSVLRAPAGVVEDLLQLVQLGRPLLQHVLLALQQQPRLLQGVLLDTSLQSASLAGLVVPLPHPLIVVDHLLLHRRGQLQTSQSLIPIHFDISLSRVGGYYRSLTKQEEGEE